MLRDKCADGHTHLHTHTHTEIGVLLSGVGALFIMFGVMLFFDRALLALGNVRRGRRASSSLR
jgi:hypothetical protein